MLGQDRKRITTSTTTTMFTESCAISQIVIAVEAAGTTWKLKIQDKPEAPAVPRVLVPETTLSAPTTPAAVIIFFNFPVYMDGGVDVVTTGTAGVVNVWITAETGS